MSDSPYHIQLDIFEGPLDLLLHLIKENRVEIADIPVSKITEQYLAHLDMMSTLNLDVAGEFLVMAATLAHIKSQMLLPPSESQDDPEDEGVDPRAELVRRLLEYQKYKDAAEQLLARPLLYRDVFKRERVPLPLPPDADTSPELVEISIFKLVEAFHRVLDDFHVDEPHEVEGETVTVSERVGAILQAVRGSAEGTIRFQDLFDETQSRRVVIATFLALLEMLKRGALRVFQSEAFSDIQLIGTPHLYGEWTYDGIDDYTQSTQIPS